jgi:hypothetical protein
LKLGRVIGLYLLKHHSVSLPGFGVLRYDPTHSAAAQGEEIEEFFPEGSLSFSPDPKAPIEESLLVYISQETGKMKSLARSDMDSFLQFGQELINISKPFHLEGIGILQRNAKNELEFVQAAEQIPVDPFKRTSASGSKRKRRPINAPSASSLRKAGLAVIVLLIAGATWLGIRWMAEQRPEISTPPPDTETITRGIEDKLDTTASKTTTAKTDAPSQDSFGVVFPLLTRQRALKRFADLKEWGHNVRMVTRDSVSFKLYILINAPLRDSAKHRDSLAIFFNRRVWIETHPDEKP